MEPLRWQGTIHTVLRSVHDRITPVPGERAIAFPKGLASTEQQAHEWVRYETYRGNKFSDSSEHVRAWMKSAAAASAALRSRGQGAGIDAETANGYARTGAKHQRYYAQLQKQLIASEGPFEFRFGVKEEIDG